MRVKIILPNLLLVLLIGLLSYFYLSMDLREKAKARLLDQLAITAQMFARSEALRGYELLFDVRSHAMTKDVTEVFAQVEIQAQEGETQAQVDKKIRQEWYKRAIKSVEMYTELWGEKHGKKPEIVFITDRNGVVIARNTTPNACPAGHNVSSAIPVVARALDGESTYSIWSLDDSPFGTKAPDDKRICSLINTGMLELAAAPVWIGDDVAGALIIGFEVSNGTAAKKSKTIGLDLAVLTGGHIYSSSFTNDTTRQSLDQQLREVAAKAVDTALSSGKNSEVVELAIEGAPYLALISPVPNAEEEDQIANVLLGSLDDATADYGSLVLILIAMALAGIIVIIFGVVLGNHFLRPVMQIEEGLLKVINGEFNYRFDIKSDEVGGLSYRINQLIGVLTGEEEESEEEG
jgi:hypothetical protein